MQASNISKKKKNWVFLAVSLIILLCGVVACFTFLGDNTEENFLSQNLAEPLGSAKAAKYDINVGTGNLTIDSLASDEKLLVSGTLQYQEFQGKPTWTVETSNGQTNIELTASGGKQAGFQLPWENCNGETDWQIHLNPNLPSDITANSGGGNIKVNLASMSVTSLAANTGGGNVDVVLPINAADLSVKVKSGGGNVNIEVGGGLTGSSIVNASSGAGNVVVHVPDGFAILIHSSTGLGKLIIDPQFIKFDDYTYQSPDYDNAVDTIEITVESGAGDVSVITN